LHYEMNYTGNREKEIWMMMVHFVETLYTTADLISGLKGRRQKLHLKRRNTFCIDRLWREAYDIID